MFAGTCRQAKFMLQTEPFWHFFAKMPLPKALEGRIGGSAVDNWKQSKTNLALSGLKKINLFIGPNNSGKSYLLKEILRELKVGYLFIWLKYLLAYRQRKTLFRESLETFRQEICLCLQLLKQYYQNLVYDESLLVGLSIVDLSNFLTLCLFEKEEKIQTYLQEHFLVVQKNLILLLQIYKHLFTQKTQDENSINWQADKRLKLLVDSLEILVGSLQQLSESESLPLDLILGQFDLVYIPTKRILVEDCTSTDWPILNLVTVTKQIAEQVEKNNLPALERFSTFLSTKLFHGQKVSLEYTKISKHTKPDVYLRIGKEYKRLGELADGLAQLIILCFPLFFYSEAICLIEEPELNLHPGWQRTLMKIYLKNNLQSLGVNTDRFLFLFSTHSNYLLDAAVEIEHTKVSVFQVHKEIVYKKQEETKTHKTNSQLSREQFYIQQRKIDDLVWLNRLGVDLSSVFLTKGVIFVEGLTDVLYIRKWLELWQEEQKALYQTQGKEFVEVCEGIDFSIQTLDARWLQKDFQFCLGVLSTKSAKPLFCLVPKHLLVLDSDGDYLASYRPDKLAYEENGNGQNKREILKNSMLSQDLAFEQLKAYQGLYTGEFTLNLQQTEQKISTTENRLSSDLLGREILAFWVNAGTVETYLESFFQKHKPLKEPQWTSADLDDWQKLQVLFWQIQQKLGVLNGCYFDLDKRPTDKLEFRPSDLDVSQFSQGKVNSCQTRGYFFIPEGKINLEGRELSFKVWLAHLISRLEKIPKKGKMSNITFADFAGEDLQNSDHKKKHSQDYIDTSLHLKKQENKETLIQKDLRRKIQALYWTIRFWQKQF